MIVKCKKILSGINRMDRENGGLSNGRLTVDKEYFVLCLYVSLNNMLGVAYQIEADDGSLIIFEADQFEIVSSYIPSNWEIAVTYYVSGEYDLELRPRAWNKAWEKDQIDFYEDITVIESPLERWRNHAYIPEFMRLYFQEKDLIIREEEERRMKKKVLSQDHKEKSMIVRCIKILEGSDRKSRREIGLKNERLAVGKEYSVLSLRFTREGILEYQLEADDGTRAFFEADQFEVVLNNIPSNWEISIIDYTDDHSYDVQLYPRASMLN